MKQFTVRTKDGYREVPVFFPFGAQPWSQFQKVQMTLMDYFGYFGDLHTFNWKDLWPSRFEETIKAEEEVASMLGWVADLGDTCGDFLHSHSDELIKLYYALGNPVPADM